MFPRLLAPHLIALAGQYPVVTVTGPRQSGKTTLLRETFPDRAYVNLEAPDTRAYAVEDPRGFLAQFPDGVILDEIQRTPELPSYLQELVDATPTPGRFLLTGSQQFEVMGRISQSLAGRTALLKLLPLSLPELAAGGVDLSIDRNLLAGGYPRIHARNLDPTQALGDYFETYVQRDLRQLMAIKDLALFEKFVRLCAGRVGQLLNLHTLASDTGISHPTARAWITLLEASYIVFLLQPWHANVSKRLIKSPKLYFHDVGLACYLLGIENETHVSRHPLRGALFENLALSEALKHRLNRARHPNMRFYRDAGGLEVDLLLESGGTAAAVEIKAGATVAADMLGGLKRLETLWPQPLIDKILVYGGTGAAIRSGVRIVPLKGFAAALAELEAGSES
ncbi:MAG: ATP-binding protein [Rhodocyclaceae bacterium]|jgi:predicted AAA+ superfamily ATPase|nr:ATP-binding protein [Rhodocyclaceae bacterium]